MFLASCFRQLRCDHVLAVDIGRKLFAALQSGVMVSLTWVLGHSGIFGNEMADQLSRKSGLVARVQEATLVVAPHDLRPVV